jgi:hypothetical protein
MPTSLKLLADIKSQFHEYIAPDEPLFADKEETIDLRAIARSLNVLPILLNWSGAYAIDRDGQVMLFMYETPDAPIPETDARIINMVLFAAANTYPTLKELAPVRSSTSVDCPSCAGTGVINDPDLKQISPPILCYCGGLGWIPGKENND